MVKFISKNWVWLAVLLVICIGLFFRLWNIDNVPPGIYPDEAKNANDAIESLQSGNYQLFYPDNNGREGLYMWLVAASFAKLGINIFSFKLVSALLGTLAILGAFLLTREFLRYSTQDTGTGSKFKLSGTAINSAGVLAAGLTATSFWHINFSRIGFRAIFVPTLLAFGLYWTLKAMRKKSLSAALAAGFVWGLGFYTYISFRFAILIPVFLVTAAFIVYLLTENRPRLNWGWFKSMYIRDKWWHMDALFVVMGAVALPLIALFARNSDLFVSRSGGISIFDAGNPMLAFLKSLGLHLQMLVFRGDANWRHNFSEEPQLMAPVALLFLAGVIYSLIVMWRAKKEKNWHAIAAHCTLAISAGLMLAPAALTIEGIPHALRAIGLMPIVFIYASLGFLYLLQLVFPHKHHREEVWPFAFGAVVVIILLLTSFQFTHYFTDWGRNAHVEGAFNKDFVEIGRYINGIEDSVQKYVIVNVGGVETTYPDNILAEPGQRLPVAANTVLFMQRTKELPVDNTLYITKEQLPAVLERKSVFIPLNSDDAELKQLIETRFPQGASQEFKYFWTYTVE